MTEVPVPDEQLHEYLVIATVLFRVNDTDERAARLQAMQRLEEEIERSDILGSGHVSYAIEDDPDA